MFWSRSQFWARRWFGGGALLAVMPMAAAGCHGRHHGHGSMSEADMREHAHDAAEFVLDHVDATPDQETRMEEILDRLVPDMLAFRPERQAIAKELQDALGAAQVDPQRVEAVRQKALDLANRASARIAQGLVEAAQVLDVSQRQKLVAHWQRRHRS